MIGKRNFKGRNPDALETLTLTRAEWQQIDTCLGLAIAMATMGRSIRGAMAIETRQRILRAVRKCWAKEQGGSNVQS